MWISKFYALYLKLTLSNSKVLSHLTFWAFYQPEQIKFMISRLLKCFHEFLNFLLILCWSVGRIYYEYITNILRIYYEFFLLLRVFIRCLRWITLIVTKYKRSCRVFREFYIFEKMVRSIWFESWIFIFIQPSVFFLALNLSPLSNSKCAIL